MRIFVFIVILIFSRWLPAQEGFIQSYDFDRPGAIFSGMLLSEDTLIVSGLIFPDDSTNQQGILFSKIDTSGNIIDLVSHFDTSGYNYALGNIPNGMIRLEDNSGYLITGAVFETLAPFIMKLDNDGALLWRKEYSDSLSPITWIRDIIEIDTGFLIVGRKQALDGELNKFAIKTDKAGNQVWSKDYGVDNNRSDELNNILFLNNNEFVLGGSTSPDQNTPFPQWSFTTNLMGIDSLGNELWTWESAPGFEEVSMNGLHRDEERNWVYVSEKADFISPAGALKQAKFIIRDTNFNILVEQHYDELDQSTFSNMIKLSNNDWLALGRNYELVEEPNIASAHFYSWIVRLEEAGDTIWTREDLVFPDTSWATDQYVHSAVELPSDNIIAAGHYSSFGDPKDYGFLIKVDCHGNIDTLLYCDELTSFISSHLATPTVVAYPNPANNLVIFKVKTSMVEDNSILIIRNVEGKIVAIFDKLSPQSSFRWVTNDMPRGMYFYQLLINNSMKDSGKIILVK